MLLSQKVAEARSQGIHVMTNILIPAQVNIKEMDLCGLLMNLFDNAIEASKSIEKPDIQLTIKMVKNYLSIEMKNKVPQQADTKHPPLTTSKKSADQHGYGLKVVRSIVKKYDGMADFAIKNSYFIASILLQTKNRI